MADRRNTGMGDILAVSQDCPLIEIPPWTFRGLIAPSAALFLFGFAILMKESLRVPREQWRPLFVASLLNITGWHIFSALGLRQMASGHASIIAYTMPLWAISWDFFWPAKSQPKSVFWGWCSAWAA